MVSQNHPIALVGFFAGHWSNVDGVQLIKAWRNGPRSSRSNILSFAVAELYARIVAIHMEEEEVKDVFKNVINL